MEVMILRSLETARKEQANRDYDLLLKQQQEDDDLRFAQEIQDRVEPVHSSWNEWRKRNPIF